MKRIIGFTVCTLVVNLSFSQTGETLQTVTDRGSSTSAGRELQLLTTIPGKYTYLGGNNSYARIGAFNTNIGYDNLIINEGGGNVGIGTTAPGARLHVAGTGNYDGLLTGYSGFRTGNGNAEALTMLHDAAYISGFNNNGSSRTGYLQFNAGQNIILAAETAGNLSFRTADIERLKITSTGNVGIGTSSPAYTLDVNGPANFSGDVIINKSGEIGGTLSLFNPAKTAAGTANVWRLYNMSGAYGNSLQFWAYDNTGCGGGLCHSRFTLLDNGNVGIGTSTPTYKLDVNGTIASTATESIRLMQSSAYIAGYNSTNSIRTGYIQFNEAANVVLASENGAKIALATNGSERLSILPNGNVAIGTADAGTYKLAVDGVVGARKIKVTQEVPWADYVFDSSYQLAPLHQVEKFIHANKHLPDVPTAAEVRKDGLDVGDNQVLLLKKIEELTLYIIAQNKQILQQNEEMQKMNLRLKALETGTTSSDVR